MRSAAVAFAFTTLCASAAMSVPPPAPWAFGMSPEEVESVTDFGPYKRFMNGDVETYKGVFNGHEENFQFFFENGRLRRVGIYLYEGPDGRVAGQRWQELHATLAAMYGAVRTSGNSAPIDGDRESEAEFARRAAALAAKGVKTQMVPATQPNDAYVFSSFMGGLANGFYLVVLYYDRRS